MTESLHLPVASAYDRWAATYDGYDNPMVFLATHILAQHLPTARNLDVFEFGCGTGRNLKALQAAGARSVAGCDLSAGMLAHAPNAFQHDITTPLPVPDRSAGLVLFSLTLEHIEHLTPPLSEARRILRPSGRILVIEIHPFLSLSGIAAHFNDGSQEITMPTFPHQFSNYLAAFAAAGLRLDACREWRPIDLGAAAPPKVFKRGPESPLAVEFQLVPNA